MSDELVNPETNSAIVLNYSQLQEDERELIDQTIKQIKDIVEDAAFTLMEKIGELLIDNFYGNNLELASEIYSSSNGSSKKQLFDAFTDKIESENNQGSYCKKTWLYNALKIGRDKKLLENHQDFEKYKSLTISHKIELLTIETLEEKLEWVHKIIADNLSVRTLRVAMKKDVKTNTPGMIYLSLHPEKITDVDSVEIHGGKRKSTFLENAQKTSVIIKSEIDNLNKSLENLKKLEERVKNYTPNKPGKKKQNK